MLKIKDINSVLEITKSLILNKYRVEVMTVYRNYPEESYIDCFLIKYEKVESEE